MKMYFYLIKFRQTTSLVIYSKKQGYEVVQRLEGVLIGRHFRNLVYVQVQRFDRKK